MRILYLMSVITTDDVKKLAELSRLELSQEELVQFANEIQAILTYVEQLDSVDVSGLEPTSQVTGLLNVTRNDETINYGPTSSQLLNNAPSVQDNQIKVKRMLA